LTSDADLPALVSRARGGDPIALGEIAVRCQPAVLAFLERLDPAEAEDLAQEVFAGLEARLAGYEESGRFPAWLRSVAFNLYRTRNRSIRRRREDPLTHDVDVPLAEDTSTLFRTGKERLRAAAAELPPTLREAWDLYADGYEPRDIAIRLGITPGAAATRVSRAKDFLEEKLQGGVRRS
jgi:RNA polymerase sigma factor (sigma-70 family)